MRLFALASLMVPAALSAKAGTNAADRPEAAADNPDHIICKKFTQIGSLIATDKVCKTKRGWDKERSDLSLRDPLGSCAGGGGESLSFCGH